MKFNIEKLKEIDRSGDVLAMALYLGECGVKVHPCHAETKAPLTRGDWKQISSTDAHTIKSWWQHWPNAMIGVQQGYNSGCFVLDFDESDEKGKSIVQEAAEVKAKFGELPKTLTIKTQGGGYHLMFAYPEEHTISNYDKALPHGVDVRGHSGYHIFPPSRSASGGRYTFHRMVDVAAAPDNLIMALSEEVRAEKALKDRKKREELNKATGNKISKLAGEDFNNRASMQEIARILENNGWKYFKENAEWVHYTRPSKNFGVSGAVSIAAPHVFHCFTSSTELDADKDYSPFGLFAALEHGNDHKAASRALLDLGYGEKLDRGNKKQQRRQTPAYEKKSAEIAHKGERSTDLVRPACTDVLNGWGNAYTTAAQYLHARCLWVPERVPSLYASRHPFNNRKALLADWTAPDGSITGYHFTIPEVNEEGCTGNTIPTQTPFLSGSITSNGGAVRLAPMTENGVLCVAAGIEEALAIMHLNGSYNSEQPANACSRYGIPHELAGLPVWATITKDRLTHFVPPEGCKVLYVSGYVPRLTKRLQESGVQVIPITPAMLKSTAATWEEYRAGIDATLGNAA